MKEDGLRMLLDYFLYLYRMLLGFLCLELESDDHTVPIPWRMDLYQSVCKIDPRRGSNNKNAWSKRMDC